MLLNQKQVEVTYIMKKVMKQNKFFGRIDVFLSIFKWNEYFFHRNLHFLFECLYTFWENVIFHLPQM